MTHFYSIILIGLLWLATVGWANTNDKIDLLFDKIATLQKTCEGEPL